MSKPELIDLSLLPKSLQNHLRDLAGVKDEEDDEEELADAISSALVPKTDIDDLEEHGVIVIDKEITKKTLAKASNRLLALGLDPTFNETVQIILNSPGGDTDAMWGFIDLIETSRLTVRTIAMGEICSAATEIFITGDERVMSENSVAMIHNYSTITYGSHHELIAARKWQDIEYQKSIRHYLKHSKYNTAKDVEKHVLLRNDHWLTPEEMKKHGLCETILKGRKPRKKKK
jgi:ATP-dependent protease ClpP protease subunit